MDGRKSQKNLLQHLMKDKPDFNPDGDPDTGIDKNILHIKLAQEATRWDEMAFRVNSHLKDTYAKRLELKNWQRNALEEAKRLEEEAALQQQNKKQQDKSQQKTNQINTKMKNLFKAKQSEKKHEMEQHVDSHGNRYKQVYDKSATHGDEDFDDQYMLTLYEGLTNEAVYSKEELELIACAYKSQLKDIRSAIKAIDLLETKSKFDSKRPSMEKYKNGLIVDLCTKGKEQIEMLEIYCVQVAAKPLPLIFFLKMQADIYRYMAEHTQKYTDTIEFTQVLPSTYIREMQKKYGYSWKLEEPMTLKQVYREEAWKHYKKARFISKKREDDIALSAQKQTIEIDAIQLGLALNYAVFLWEVIETPEWKKYALRHLKKTIQRALNDFDTWNKEDNEKIQQQVELIQENINQWIEEGVNTDTEEEN